MVAGTGLGVMTAVYVLTIFLWRQPEAVSTFTQETGEIGLQPYRSAGVTGDSRVVDLGKILFFDPRVSRNNDVSCSTCHDPAKGMADGRPLAIGQGGKILKRHSPSLINLDSRAPYFWDGRAGTLEEQVMSPVANEDEMGQDPDALVRELSEVPEYLARFDEAFPGTGITKETIARAIADFERTLISSEAPLDRYLLGDRQAMSSQAVEGMKLFMGKADCMKCHDGAQLTDNGFHNIGLRGEDEGRFKVVPVKAMTGAFKTPTLRNIALTAPYFHDGSASTLEEVVAHYDRGGIVKDNLDPVIKPLHLTEAEKSALVAFMRALTGVEQTLVVPRRPGSAQSLTRESLMSLMKENEGMLDLIDRIAMKIDEKDWDMIAGYAGKMISNAEGIESFRLRDLNDSQLKEFRMFLGRLVIDLGRLKQASDRKHRAEIVATYRQVRGRCDDCHRVFRPDRGPQ